jgi:hypothetical protein
MGRMPGVGGSVVPRADILKLYGLSHSDARGLLGIPEIRRPTTAFDALKAHAQSASRQIDMIGPHAKNTMTPRAPTSPTSTVS